MESVRKLHEDFERADEINAENLRRILWDNRDTDYGKRYGFSEIRSDKEYKEKVPLTEYSAYESLSQSPRAFTAYSVRSVLATSGTTGRQKEFLITHEALERYFSYIYEMPYFLMGGRDGPHLHTSVFRPAAGGKTLLSSAYYGYLAESGGMNCDTFLGGKELMFSDRIGNVPYVKAWLLLCCPELVSVQSIFLYDVLLVFTYLERNWRELLSDLKAGSISEKLDGAVKEKLLECRPGRAEIAAMEKIFSQGFGTPVVPRIWKRLRFVSGIGGGMYEIQEKALKKYIGDIPIYYFAYASSECMAGAAIEMNRAEYALLPESAFYEFLSADGGIVSEQNLETGKKYELIVTTFSGLYRYRTGDIIEITSFAGKAPVFRITGRTKNVLNIAGEKLHGETAGDAVGRWSETANIDVRDFAMGVNAARTPGVYCLFVEGDVKTGTGEAEVCLDRVLCSLSPDYADTRSLGMIGPPKIYFLNRGEIMGAISPGGSGTAHNKPHLFLSEKQTQALIECHSFASADPAPAVTE